MEYRGEDPRTTGNREKKHIDTEIDYYAIIFPEGEGTRSVPLSNDPIDAESLFMYAVKEGLFIPVTDGIVEWINLGVKDYAYVTLIKRNGNTIARRI